MLFRSTRRAPPWSPRRGFFTSGGFEWMHCAGWQSDLFFPRAMSAMPPPPPFILRLLGSDDVELTAEMLTVFREAFDEAGTFNDARPSPAYLAPRPCPCQARASVREGKNVSGGVSAGGRRR